MAKKKAPSKPGNGKAKADPDIDALLEEIQGNALRELSLQLPEVHQIEARSTGKGTISEIAWAESPLSFHEFVNDPWHMGQPPLSDRQRKDIETFLGEHPVTVFSRLLGDEAGAYREAVLVWGKGGGKDWICTMVQCYGNSPHCVFSRKTENSYLSFGPHLARKLNADYSIVAISGVGVTKNYGDSLRTSEFPLPYYYDRTCMNDTLLWDFSQWQPDAVVVCLGRNDYRQKPHPKREMFRTAYLKLINDIRRNYPSTHIFTLCSPMRKDPHCDYISSIVNELKYKNGDKKIHFIKMDVKFNEKRDFGCEKHPNRFGHKKLADFLEPIIRKELGWESLLKRIIPSNPFAKK